ncbi:hypothetical protein T06_9204 [Trichinella sp. T6]|nr:hypothetical protein T06_9204 [Trichinella sp. T6]
MRELYICISIPVQPLAMAKLSRYSSLVSNQSTLLANFSGSLGTDANDAMFRTSPQHGQFDRVQCEEKRVRQVGCKKQANKRCKRASLSALLIHVLSNHRY